MHDSSLMTARQSEKQAEPCTISLSSNAASLRQNLFSDSRTRNDRDNMIRLSFDNSAGRGLLDFIEFNPDFNIIVSDCFWAQAGFIKYAGEGWVRFNFCIDATACFDFEDHGSFELRGQELRVFYQPEGVNCGHRIDAGGRSICVTISVKRPYLETIIGKALDLSPALASRDATDGFFFKRFELAPASLRAVADLLKMRHRGTLRLLYAKAKSEELLVTALSGVQIDDTPRAQPLLRSTDRQRISEVREILDGQFADPPSVSALARRFGINRNKLAYGFREMNNRSMGEYICEKRLETAWSLLLDTDMPVTLVANEVGYAHVQSFSTAFRRRYGFSPRSLRHNPTAD